MEALRLQKHSPLVKRIFLSMLLPTIFMNLTTALASFADTVIIGAYLDELSLSVVTFATPIYMVINTFAALFAVGGSIVMSIFAGSGEKEAANRAFSIAVELLFAVGLLLLAVGLVFGRQIPGLLGAGPDVYEQVYQYAIIVLVAAPIFMLNVGLAFFVRNDGCPTLPVIGMFLSVGVNILLDIVFVGFCHMGVAGAALATVLGQLVSAVVISAHFFTKKNTLKFRFALNKTAGRIVTNGISTALHFVYQFLAILIFNHFVVRLAGTEGVVVYTVVFNLYTLSLALFEGLSQTIQPMVSVFYGERNNKKIKDTLHLAFLTTLILCGTLTVVLELFPQVVPMIFGITEGDLLLRSMAAVRLFAVSMIIMTVNVLLGYYLQSTENSLMSSVLVSLRCFVFFLLGAVVLAKVFAPNYVWGTYAFAEVLTFLVYVLMTRAKRKKQKAQGVETDLYLLECRQEENTFGIAITGQPAEMAIEALQELFKNDPALPEHVKLDASDQLTKRLAVRLGKDAYLEVELNALSHKVTIRDTMPVCCEELELQHGSTGEMSPVLGMNRICIE